MTADPAPPPTADPLGQAASAPRPSTASPLTTTSISAEPGPLTVEHIMAAFERMARQPRPVEPPLVVSAAELAELIKHGLR